MTGLYSGSEIVVSSGVGLQENVCMIDETIDKVNRMDVLQERIFSDVYSAFARAAKTKLRC